MKAIKTLVIAVTGVLSSCSLVSCANQYASITPGFYRPALPSEAGAEFGYFVQQSAIWGDAVDVTPQK